MSKPSWKTIVQNLDGRVFYLVGFLLRGCRPRWRTIAGDLDAQCSYLLRRCLAAEGHEGDQAAMMALIADAEDISGL
jgi:hypothetical protein